ncbi:GerAB/ArcD/ProY family transporter [Paenibacillus arenilitoris]|uniref:Endospore germination permease n=1 Tax=Paenibacillus arenilitoris TaxID=2772299 RepID=A0A927CNI7_9BACL|nr:endospore germination permease [Paenibacillus arenilitoris]MBD2870567.1 endospore germination permease [Paenibacillus arenilitoris]
MKISVRQFTILVILGVIGDSILILPTITATSAKQDAWLSMLLAMLLGMGAGWLFASIADRLRGESPVTAMQARLGAWAGGAAGLLLLFNFFMCVLTLLSEMSQFMTTQLMPETPVNAILIVFLAVVIVAYRYGLEAFARMSELLFPVFALLLVFLVVFLIPQVKIENLQPIGRTGFFSIWEGALPSFAAGFAEMVVLLMLVPHVAAKGKLRRPILTGFAVGGAMMLAVVLLCVTVLGPSLMETKYYPTFVLAQKITVGDFLERLEAIMAFLWIITVFNKVLLLYYGLTTGLSQLLKLREDRMLTIPLGMILLVCTVIGTPNITVYNEIIVNDYPWFDMTFGLALPALLLALLLVKRSRKMSGE